MLLIGRLPARWNSLAKLAFSLKGDAMTHSEDDPRRKFDLNVMAWVGGAVVIILAVIAVYTFSA